MDEVQLAQPSEESPSAPELYEAPRLVVLGDATALTQGGCFDEHGHFFCFSA